MIKLNNIPILIKQNLFNYNENSIKMLLFFTIIMAGISLLYGSIKENIINSTSIVVMLITGFSMYIIIKRQYKNKIKDIKRNLEICKNPTIMDKICENHKSNKKCKIYNRAKKEFYNISNVLVQNINFKKFKKI